MAGQNPIQENQIAEYALPKTGGIVSDTGATSPGTGGLVRISRIHPGGPALEVNNINTGDLQITAAGGAFQVDSQGRVNGQTISAATMLNQAQKTALTGGPNVKADDYHSHSIPSFFHYHGTISDGMQLQVPSGFTSNDMHYIVSPSHYLLGNVEANQPFELTCNIDENRIVTFEVVNGTRIATNRIANYYVTAYKEGTGSTNSSGSTPPYPTLKAVMGYWDGLATEVDFSTGIITIDTTDLTAIDPTFVGYSDVLGYPTGFSGFNNPPLVIWSVLNENLMRHYVGVGGYSDHSFIASDANFGGEKKSPIVSWNQMKYTNIGVKTTNTNLGSSGLFLGRTGFLAIGIND